MWSDRSLDVGCAVAFLVREQPVDHPGRGGGGECCGLHCNIYFAAVQSCNSYFAENIAPVISL